MREFRRTSARKLEERIAVLVCSRTKPDYQLEPLHIAIFPLIFAIFGALKVTFIVALRGKWIVVIEFLV